MPANNDNEKKQHLLQYKENHKNTKESLHRWVKQHEKEGRFSISIIYTDTQISMQSIKYNKENYQKLNWIYDILVELHAQDEKITHGN